MAVTYDPAQLATSKMMQVRLMIGDIDTKAANGRCLDDAEIQFRLDTTAQVVLHAAVLAGEDLIARWAHREVGTVQNVQQQRYDWLVRRIAELRNRLTTYAAPINTGASKADHLAAQQDTDRVQPAFTRDMIDNPQAGSQAPDLNETED